MSSSISIGPYVVGEKPAALEYAFLDSSGTAIDITGWTVKFQCQEQFGSVFTGSGTVSNGTAGKALYAFTGAEFPTPGTYRGQFWVGNGTNRFASVDIRFTVASAVGTAPSI